MDTIQGSHYNFSFYEILFNYFKLLFDLSNPCEVRLYSLKFMYIHIFQLVLKICILIDVLSFEHLCQRIIYFLRCLECIHMGDEVILNIVCNNSLILIHASLISIISLISLWFWNISSNKLMQVIFFKDHRGYVLTCPEVINPSNFFLKLSMVKQIFKMRTSNGKSKYLDLTYLRCLTKFQSSQT